jgi:hypothetical protein
MGSYTRRVEAVDCGTDHGYDGPCPGDHFAEATYHRTSDMVTLKVDNGEIVMTDRLFFALLTAMQGMAENGGF